MKNGAARNGGNNHVGDSDRPTSSDTSPVDLAAARSSMERLRDIYREIAETADKSMKGRCPYKDAKSRCTAKFGCRNQVFTKNPVEPPVCTARDGLDYRSAWEVDSSL